MKAMKAIITHAGPAHLDDFLGICLLLSEAEVSVERRVPTPQELDDPQVWVVDVGGRYEPEKHNFDHHQQGGPSECALRLVARYLGVDEVLDQVYPWYRLVDLRDCQGPAAVCCEVGVTMEQVQLLYSPIEKELLDWFASRLVWGPASPMLAVMARIGKSLVDGAKARMAALEEWRTFPRHAVKGLLVIDARDGKATGGSMFGFDLYRPECSEVAVVLTKNPRGGVSLTRIDDHPKVDFRRLEGRSEVTFIHKNGFLAVVKDDAEISQLLEAAID